MSSQHQALQLQRDIDRFQSQVSQAEDEIDQLKNEILGNILISQKHLLQLEDENRNTIMESQNEVRDSIQLFQIDHQRRCVNKKNEKEKQQEHHRHLDPISDETSASSNTAASTSLSTSPHNASTSTWGASLSTTPSTSPTKRSAWSAVKRKRENSSRNHSPSSSLHPVVSIIGGNGDSSNSTNSGTQQQATGWFSSLFGGGSDSQQQQQPQQPSLDDLDPVERKKVLLRKVHEAQLQMMKDEQEQLQKEKQKEKESGEQQAQEKLNPNQLGELLIDPVNPDWFTAHCLSTSIQRYFSKEIVPKRVVLSNNNSPESAGNTTSAASSSASSSGGNNNNSNNNNNNNNKDGLNVDPIWLHVENNNLVTNSVQPSVFDPFPSFSEHNSDEHLRSVYKEMYRRSAADRARREGTTLSVPGCADNTATGGFVANDVTRIYGPSSSASVAPMSPKSQAARKASTGQVRRIRADEYRVAFFAPELFEQVHEAIDGFDVKQLVEHAAFDWLPGGLNSESNNNNKKKQNGKKRIWRAATSPGKSESIFFFFGHFVAKQLKEHEFRFFLDRFLPAYVDHVKMNRFTLLPQFLALVSIADLSKGSNSLSRFVIMNNVFPTKRVIHRMYDLKGSTVNRDGLIGDLTTTSFGAILLKDNDLPPKLLSLGPLRSRLLINQLRCDTDFLNGLTVIDYSLLVGIRSDPVKVGAQEGVMFKKRKKSFSGKSVSAAAAAAATGGQQKQQDENEEAEDDADEEGEGKEEEEEEEEEERRKEGEAGVEDGSCFRSWDGGMPSLPIYDGSDMTSARVDTFYIGLIDVLQSFTATKKLEAIGKEWLFSGAASVVPPDQFAQRMVDKIIEITD